VKLLISWRRARWGVLVLCLKFKRCIVSSSCHPKYSLMAVLGSRNKKDPLVKEADSREDNESTFSHELGGAYPWSANESFAAALLLGLKKIKILINLFLRNLVPFGLSGLPLKQKLVSCERRAWSQITHALGISTWPLSLLDCTAMASNLKFQVQSWRPKEDKTVENWNIDDFQIFTNLKYHKYNHLTFC